VALVRPGLRPLQHLPYGLVSRESKANGCGPEITHLRLNREWAGLIRQFISLGTIALGTS